jgi:tRNA 2-thiouridine synthesizing protein E
VELKMESAKEASAERTIKTPIPRPRNADLAALEQRVRELTVQVAALVERQRARDELFEEMRPVMKAVMATATDELQRIEDKGYFTFLREGARVVDRIVESYGEDDVRQLGDNIVRIMDTVRALTQPQVLAVAREASEAIDEADKLEPTGLFGMVRATRDADVQLGMAVFLDILRHVGRGVKEMSSAGTAERKPLPARAAAALPAPQARPPRPAPKQPAAPPPVVIDGVAFDAGGYMIDASQWSPELAVALAASLGISELGERHWQALNAARQDFLERSQSPNVRRLSAVSGLAVKELYALFPKAPGMTVARIAGCPKPVGCI